MSTERGLWTEILKIITTVLAGFAVLASGFVFNSLVARLAVLEGEQVRLGVSMAESDIRVAQCMQDVQECRLKLIEHGLLLRELQVINNQKADQ